MWYWMASEKGMNFRVLGVVVGKHITVEASTAHQQGYINRKGFHSMQLL